MFTSARLFVLIPLAALASVAGAGESEQDVQSITGSSQRSITGSSQRSITGSSRRSITGSSQRSITGSSQRSITGSSQRSITGSSQRSITGSSQRSINDVLLYGPVTSAGAGGLSILGATLKVEGDAYANLIGRTAYAEGQYEEGVVLAEAIAVLDEVSVPGASAVTLAGQIEEYDASV